MHPQLQLDRAVSRTVVLSTFNTISIAPGEVVLCVTQFPGLHYYNVMNLGPCTLYYRDDVNPGSTDARSLTLPPSTADNLVIIPNGPVGLRFMTDGPCVESFADDPVTTMTLRLVRG
jgi:FtsP/CotA-like multicopper oxidase with cupredoxin domain